jgi:CSLREA domain-containing protein
VFLIALSRNISTAFTAKGLPTLIGLIVIALLVVWVVFSGGFSPLSNLGIPLQQVPPTATPVPGIWGYALRFFGNGVNDIDRVKIRIDPNTPIDVGGDFTLEWWMKATLQDNTASANCGAEAGWITGNIMLDRDVFGSGDTGDYGVVLSGGRIAFGVSRGSSGTTLCGSITVADGVWHHVAVTRNSSTGQLAIFVDGVLDEAGTGPTGDVSYRNGRPTSYPNSDPYLVIGAEKHDAGRAYPSYRGMIDEFRISNSIRYTANFTLPTGPFTPDTNTVGLYHFDEGSGTSARDSATVTGAPTNGVLRVGGNPVGPVYTGSDIGQTVNRRVNSADDVSNGICDVAHCSLREAITVANSAPGPDVIVFNIPGAGVHTIRPTSNLPPITDSVIIDGTSQPGYSGTPLIQLDGSSIPAGQNSGLNLTGSNITVRGLAINRFNPLSNGYGILILGDNNIIQGNFIGTDTTGTVDQGNAIGIVIARGADGNLIGGTAASARNLISGNNVNGIALAGMSNTIQGNYIGTNVAGTGDLGNGILGIDVSNESANNNLIGGTTAGSRNIIAFNDGLGIGLNETVGNLFGNFSTGIGILGNSIHSNHTASNQPWLGIDLWPQGVNANDAGDGDVGANNRQNYPVLSFANTGSGAINIGGTLNSTPSTAFRLEFFSNTACDPSGFGEGQNFLGAVNVTTNSSGNASFAVSFAASVPLGAFITATATTNPGNNTSEFSQCVAVTPLATATPTYTATTIFTPSNTPTPLTATPTSTVTLPPSPPAVVTVPTLTPTNPPPPTAVPPPTATPTATNTPFLTATPTVTNTPLPSPPGL